MTKAAILTLFCAATVLCPQIAQAMTVEMYDAMAVEDQRDYLKLLVNRAHGVFIAQDRRDLAAKLEEMFRTHRGEPQPPGEAQFVKYLAITRDHVAREDHTAFPLKSLAGEVEGALIGSLQKNGIPMSNTLFKALTLAWKAKPFWPKRPLRPLQTHPPRI